MKKTILSIFLLLIIIIDGNTQECYEIVADYSGFNTDSYQTQLQSAACELAQAFPNEFKEQFKVYDFGFYSINENFEGKFQDIWDNLVLDIESKSPYYLLFGKQSDNRGIYTKFWVSVKIPSTGSFSCIDEISSGYRSSIEKKVEVILKSTYKNSNKIPSTYAFAEIAAMDTLKYFINNITDCCNGGTCSTCLFTPEEIKSYLELNEYIKFPISITDENKLNVFDCSANSKAMREKKEPNYFRAVNSILNYVDYNIEIEGKDTYLQTLISSTMPEDGFGEFEVHIMDFDNIINNSFFEAVDKVKSAKGGIIYFIDNYSEESNLYVTPTAFDINLYLVQAYLQDINEANIASNFCNDCPEWMMEIWNNEYNSNSGSISASYIAPAIPLAAVDGPLPIADAILAAAAAAAITYDLTQKVYLTYIAYNPNLNAHYCGRTSGFGTPQSILESRIRTHHAVTLGFEVDIDRTMQVYPYSYWSIRGREQQNIDFYGRALSDSERRPNATCVNSIRGVAKYNPFGYLYHWSSNSAWGEKHPYTGYGEEDIEELWDKFKELKRMKKWLGL